MRHQENPLPQYVCQDEWVRLTRDYTVVDAAAGSNQLVREAVGRCLWDAFPTADQVFKPFYEQAWRDGLNNGVVFFLGSIVMVSCRVDPDGTMLVNFRDLPLHGLRQALHDYEDWRDDQLDDQSLEQRALRLIHNADA